MLRWVMICVMATATLFMPDAHGSSINSLGDVTEIFYDGIDLYFFEVDRSYISQTWVHDTRLVKYDGSDLVYLSDELFLYPTELIGNDDYLYFIVLSDSCAGSILCDYQDLIRIERADGAKQILIKELKSAAHIHMTDNLIYLSESNGNIWKIHFDGSKQLVYTGKNIIMDVVANGDRIFWIEEITESHYRIMSTNKENEVTIIYESQHVLHTIQLNNQQIRWNEIQVRLDEKNTGDFTVIYEFDGEKTKKILEFKNTSDAAKLQPFSHYKPYVLAGDYVFLVNNTKSQPSLHMIHIYNGTNTTLDPNIQKTPVFLKAEYDRLFMVEKMGREFSIEQYFLPVIIPEFPVSVLVLITGILFVISSKFIWFRHVSF